MELNKQNKRLSKTVKNGSQTQEPKRTKNTTYNKYFTENETLATAEKNTSAENSVSKSESNVQNPVASSSSSSSLSTDLNDRSEKSDLIQLVECMSAVCHVSFAELESVCKTIHLYRTKSSLGTCETEISEADAPLLSMFEKYALPLKTIEEVEQLENELENSNDFLKFFIRRIVPIVKNLYQKHTSILEGFIGSLISHDIIAQFKWAGRIENTVAFKELKNIQVVLLSAMVRVDPNYTMYQFENDIKTVLQKSVFQTKKNEGKNTADKKNVTANDSEVNDGDEVDLI